MTDPLGGVLTGEQDQALRTLLACGLIGPAASAAAVDADGRLGVEILFEAHSHWRAAEACFHWTPVR